MACTVLPETEPRAVQAAVEPESEQPDAPASHEQVKEERDEEAKALPQAPARTTAEASTEAEPARRQRHRAEDRLRLAKVVLEAGFPADAARAAYDALAHGIASRLPGGQRPATHDALVVAVYRDLLPSGRLAPSAPGVLARLHDLTMLEAHGVEVDAVLAADVLAEAEGWVERLSDGTPDTTTLPDPEPSGGTSSEVG